MEDRPLSFRRFGAGISRCLDAPLIRDSDGRFGLEPWSVQVLGLVRETGEGRSRRGLDWGRDSSVIPGPGRGGRGVSVGVRVMAWGVRDHAVSRGFRRAAALSVVLRPGQKGIEWAFPEIVGKVSNAMILRPFSPSYPSPLARSSPIPLFCFMFLHVRPNKDPSRIPLLTEANHDPTFWGREPCGEIRPSDRQGGRGK
jgi:hypothetical protein